MIILSEFIYLFALFPEDFLYQDPALEKLTKMSKRALFCNVKESGKKKKNVLELHQKLMGSVVGRDQTHPPSKLKSIQQFLCNPADKPTSQHTDTGRHNHVGLEEQGTGFVFSLLCADIYKCLIVF